MRITDLLDRRSVSLTAAPKTKSETLDMAVDLMVKSEKISDREAYRKQVYLREEESTTGIGEGIAIPHGKSAHVKEIGVAIGVLKEEIPWETLDGKGVKGIILFAVGDDTEGAQKHLKLLSLFARKLGNDEVTAALLKAKEPQQVIEAFQG